MKSDLAIQLLADVLWDALLISASLLGVTLSVGLLVKIRDDDDLEKHVVIFPSTR